jgi:hypothetical protein
MIPKVCSVAMWYTEYTTDTCPMYSSHFKSLGSHKHLQIQDHNFVFIFSNFKIILSIIHCAIPLETNTHLKHINICAGTILHRPQVYKLQNQNFENGKWTKIKLNYMQMDTDIHIAY